MPRQDDETMRQMPGACVLPAQKALPENRTTTCRSIQAEPQSAKGHAVMTVTIPLVVIVGAIIYVAYRYMGLRVWQAIVSIQVCELYAGSFA
jgi:hypothetical protein